MGLPGQTILADAYQPHIYDPDDNTTLRCLRFAPSSMGTFPTVIIVHAGEFKEYDDNGSLNQRQVIYDMLNAGYLVFSVEHRLAPDGLLPGQTGHCTPGGDYTCNPKAIDSGRPPEQWNDIKQEIISASHDLQCNGNIYLIGASSGGTHVAWCALDPTPLPSPATGWPLPANVKIKAVAGLSGVYELSYRGGDATPTFINDVVNYTNTTDTTTQSNDSPLSLVPNATNIPPFILFTSDSDPVPFEIADSMKAALLARGVDAEEHHISGSDHASIYWHENDKTGTCVSTEVLNFFESHK